MRSHLLFPIAYIQGSFLYKFDLCHSVFNGKNYNLHFSVLFVLKDIFYQF